MVLRFAICVCVVASLSCGASPTKPATSTVTALLAGSSSELRVDRVWAGAPGSPTYPTSDLPESDFRPSTASTRYPMLFSTSAAIVSLGDSLAIKGSLASETAGRATYTLNEGLFAGGRLVIWQAGAELQGELTIYGSGVPIIKSERGTVVR